MPTTHPDVQTLIELARDKSTRSRAALVMALSDFYFGNAYLLTDQDRHLMTEILRELIRTVEHAVRKKLSERLSREDGAPHDLVVDLAKDEIEVAFPILVRSEVILDEELIEIIQYRTMEHQLAIAMRATVSEAVSDALVETKNPQVITRLLENRGARISEPTMTHLVEESQTVDSYQEPLVHRRDLPPRLVKKLYWGVSAALRRHIVDNFNIDPAQLDATIEETVRESLTDAAEDDAATDLRDLAKEPAIEEMLQHLRHGDVHVFVHRLARLLKLRTTLVRRILFEAGGEGLAIACRAEELDRHFFVQTFLWFRQGRLGDKQVDPKELSQALGFFDGLSVESANEVMQYWRKDADYLNALRLVEKVRN